MSEHSQVSQLATVQTMMSEKRGRKWAFPTLNGERTALIGCEVSRLGLALAPRLRACIPRVDWLARTLRAGGGKVFWSHFAPHAFDGPAGEILGDAEVNVMRQRLADPSWIEVSEGVQETENDRLIARGGYSAVTPDLIAAIKEDKINTVLIAGTETDGTVESTARAAATAGLRVIIVGDCCMSSDELSHTSSLSALHRRIADVRPVDEIVAELRRKMAK